MNRRTKGARKPVKPVDIDNVEDPSEEDLSFLPESFTIKRVVTMHQELRQLSRCSVSRTVCRWLLTTQKALNAKKDYVWY